MSTEALTLLQDTVDGIVVLRAPAVGLLTAALAQGRLVRGGDEAGVLSTLGRARRLVVPAGLAGRVRNRAPERVHAPVAWGDVLYELEPLSDAGEVEVAAGPAEDAGGPVLRAPYSGRLWHRPSPGDPAFVSPGDVVEAGTTVGLLEVMKTFTHLTYPSDGSLPSPAKAVRFLVADGAEVGEGEPVLAVEPA